MHTTQLLTHFPSINYDGRHLTCYTIHYIPYALLFIIFVSKLCHNVLTKIRVLLALYNNQCTTRICITESLV